MSAFTTTTPTPVTMPGAFARPMPSSFRTERLERFDRSWTKRRLPSGLTLLHLPTPGNDRFHVGVMIRAGSRLEKPDVAGVSHFLEHMMFRGSRRFPEFTRLAEASEWLGGEWNAATGQEHTEYWYSGIRHTAAEAVDLFAEFLEHPMLADIEVERAVILRELDGETNDHGHSTDLDGHIAELIWPGSSYASPILGTRETLAKINVDTLRTHRDHYYTPANMVVYAVGGDPDAAMLDLLEARFADHRKALASRPLTAFPPMQPFKGPAVRWVEHSDNEYEIQLAFLCDGEWSTHAATYDVIARILTDGFCSRLARRMREELGLVYDIHASAGLSLEAGTISITAACEKGELDAFLRELSASLSAFVKHGPQPDELQRAIVRHVVELELSPDHPEAHASRVAWGHICSRDVSLLNERERVVKLSVEEVSDLLRTTFTPERAALVALGPSTKDVEKRLRRALDNGL